MGAWIETFESDYIDLAKSSHPTWVRGLKLDIVVVWYAVEVVAPYVGAWIETVRGSRIS